MKIVTQKNMLKYLEEEKWQKNNKTFGIFLKYFIQLWFFDIFAACLFILFNT